MHPDSQLWGSQLCALLSALLQFMKCQKHCVQDLAAALLYESSPADVLSPLFSASSSQPLSLPSLNISVNRPLKNKQNKW